MNDLYFLVHLIEALQSAHPDAALRRAFHQIAARRDDERYRRGYLQFLEFMTLVKACRGPQAADFPPRAYQDLHMSISENIAWLIDELASIPELEDLWERVKLDLQDVPLKDEPIELALMKESGATSHLTLPVGARRGTFYGITPGVYQLALATGQVLWDETLGREDLCWEYGAPDMPLPLAAGGGEDMNQPTRQSTVLDGQLVIKVYPGRTRGQIEIELCKP